MNLKVITQPTKLPLSIDIVKDYLRIDFDEEDALIEGMIGAAVSHAETFTRRSLAPKTYELTLNSFKDRVRLTKPPLIEVDSVVNENGQPIDYEVLEHTGIALVSFKESFEKAVITYRAGYDKMPKPIEQAIMLLVAHFYENREVAIVGTSVERLPFSVETLLYPYKGWF